MAASQRVFARLFQTREQAEHFQVLKAVCGLECHQPWFPFRQGARFIDHQRVDLLQRFQRFSVPDQNTGLRAASLCRP